MNLNNEIQNLLNNNVYSNKFCKLKHTRGKDSIKSIEDEGFKTKISIIKEDKLYAILCSSNRKLYINKKEYNVAYIHTLIKASGYCLTKENALDLFSQASSIVDKSKFSYFSVINSNKRMKNAILKRKKYLPSITTIAECIYYLIPIKSYNKEIKNINIQKLNKCNKEVISFINENRNNYDMFINYNRMKDYWNNPCYVMKKNENIIGVAVMRDVHLAKTMEIIEYTDIVRIVSHIPICNKLWTSDIPTEKKLIKYNCISCLLFDDKYKKYRNHFIKTIIAGETEYDYLFYGLDRRNQFVKYLNKKSRIRFEATVYTLGKKIKSNKNIYVDSSYM